jgi:hypothetical protein
MCVELPTGESVIACYCENPGGHGTIDYAVCTRKKAEQCMRVMTPGIQSSPQSIRDYIVAADIEMAPPIVVGEIRRERKPGKLCGGEENE